MDMKRGQGSSEYLVLLAAVLLVALVAIVLIGGFTEAGGAARESESRAYWSGPIRPFSITDFSQTGQTFHITLKNTEPHRITMLNITVGNATYAPSGGISFKGGTKRTLTVGPLRNCTSDSYDFYEYELGIYYNTSDGVVKREQGEKLLVGECHLEE
jgi:hypothetical protein